MLHCLRLAPVRGPLQRGCQLPTSAKLERGEAAAKIQKGRVGIVEKRWQATLRIYRFFSRGYYPKSIGRVGVDCVRVAKNVPTGVGDGRPWAHRENGQEGVRKRMWLVPFWNVNSCRLCRRAAHRLEGNARNRYTRCRKRRCRLCGIRGGPLRSRPTSRRACLFCRPPYRPT